MGEDKGEKRYEWKKLWLRKKKKKEREEKEKLNKSKTWFEWDICPSCKKIYKIKITIVLGHKKLLQNYHNSWDVKFFICQN